MGEQPVKLVPVLPGVGCHAMALSDAPALVTLRPGGARMRVAPLALPCLPCAATLWHPPPIQAQAGPRNLHPQCVTPLLPFVVSWLELGTCSLLTLVADMRLGV